MLKVGVIGAGKMGKNHLRVLKELSNYYELIGFYDINKEKSLQLEMEIKVKYYSDINILLNKIDVCVLAVPSSMHYEIGNIIAKKGIHCLIEKPLCLNSKDALSLSKKFNKSKLMVGHIESFNPAVVELKSILSNQETISFQINRCSPYDPRIYDTDVIMDLMIHDLGILFNELCVEKVNKIFAVGNKKISANKFDYVQAIVNFDNNIVASIVASRSTEEKIRTIDVHTKNEYIKANLLDKTLTITRSTNCQYLVKTNYKQENIIEKVLLPFVEPLKAELIELYNSICENRLPITNASYAINALKKAELIEKKAQVTYNE